MTLGESIKAKRKERKLTQKELATQVGCAEITIRQYESDKRKPDFKTLSIIAIALEVTLRELIPIEMQRSTDQKTIELFSGFYADEAKNFNTFEEYLNYKTEQLSQKRSSTNMHQLHDCYEKLNKAGKEKLIEHAQMLTKIPEYRKNNE